MHKRTYCEINKRFVYVVRIYYRIDRFIRRDNFLCMNIISKFNKRVIRYIWVWNIRFIDGFVCSVNTLYKRMSYIFYNGVNIIEHNIRILVIREWLKFHDIVPSPSKNLISKQRECRVIAVEIIWWRRQRMHHRYIRLGKIMYTVLNLTSIIFHIIYDTVYGILCIEFIINCIWIYWTQNLITSGKNGFCRWYNSAYIRIFVQMSVLVWCVQ